MSFRSSAIGLAAVVVIVGAGAAHAVVTAEANSVDSAAIIDGQVTSADVADNGLTGVDINPGRRIVTRSVTISSYKLLAFLVTCPTGTTLSGGGFKSANEWVYLIDSYPYSATQWKIYAENDDDYSRTVTGYAICDSL